MSTPCTREECCGDGALTDLFDLLGRRYTLEILCVVWNHEPVRFGQIEDHVPEASTSTLSTRLDDLGAAGFVERQRYDEIPPRVEYELTEDGRELSERFQPVVEWITKRENAD